MNDRHYDIAIVGGGFSGTVLAIQLLKHSTKHLSIAIINRGGQPGRGVAYGTQCEEHILNVGAGKMSAFPDIPEHFQLWFAEKFGRTVESDCFPARRLYGEYIEDTLNQTLDQHGQSKLTWLNGNAVSLYLEKNLAHLKLESGLQTEARSIVLATGNAPPADPPQLDGIDKGHYFHYAWDEDALKGIPTSGVVLILGSGLTAIDQVLALHAQGFQGTVFMFSRRGQLPAVHSTCAPWTSSWADNLPNTIRLIFSAVRREVEIAASAGVDWRAVIDSLRPFSQQIWQRLPIIERKRFLRHVRTHWETVRHRVPMETHQLLCAMIADGNLCLMAGRLIRVKEFNGRVVLSICQRGTRKERDIAVDRVINCTGPGTANRVQDKLILDLINRGLARFDPLHFGLDCDYDGSLISASGQPSNLIYGIGPVCKGSLWEITAVAEIRLQAIQLAHTLLAYVEA